MRSVTGCGIQKSEGRRKTEGLSRVAALICGALAVATVAHAQFGRGGGWSAAGADAQRSSWVRTDAKINKDSLSKPGFQLLWKLKLNNQAVQLNSLGTAATLEGYIGYRGFRTLAHLAGSSNNVFAVDTDLGRLEWERHLPAPASPAAGGSTMCPGGLTADVARPISSALPGGPGNRGGPGRAGGARSGVGEAGEGAVTIAAALAAAANRGGGFGGAGRGNQPRTLPHSVYAISSDGKLHSLLVSNGEPAAPAMDFVPANANAHGLIVVDNAAYAATMEGCSGSSNALYALDLFEKKPSTWKPASGAIAGSVGPAFAPDGSLFVATTAGDLVHLEGKTLAVKETYSGGKPGFATSPVVFSFKDKTMVAAAGGDGRIHLLDAASPGTAVAKSLPVSTAAVSSTSDAAPSALASWEDADGNRWILEAVTGAVASEAGFNRKATNGAVVAWKVVDQNGTPALQAGWISPDLTLPTLRNAFACVRPMNPYPISPTFRVFIRSPMHVAQALLLAAPALLPVLGGHRSGLRTNQQFRRYWRLSARLCATERKSVPPHLVASP